MDNPIDKVWEFYTDVKHLEIVTPKEMRLRIINTTSEKLTQGSEHLHIFHSINDQKQTEVLDEISLEIPYGHVGKLFEGYAYAQLQKLFDHRKAATIITLQGNK